MALDPDRARPLDFDDNLEARRSIDVGVAGVLLRALVLADPVEDGDGRALSKKVGARGAVVGFLLAVAEVMLDFLLSLIRDLEAEGLSGSGFSSAERAAAPEARGMSVQDELRSTHTGQSLSVGLKTVIGP